MKHNWRKLAQHTLMLTGVYFALSSTVIAAGTLTEQRVQYQAAKNAWDNNNQLEIDRLMPKLTSYPLYPYLEYRALSQRLSSLTVKEVDQFIAAYPGFPLNSNLSRNFASELSRREDWRGLLAFEKQEPKPMAARCHYQYAKWATGNKKEAFRATNDIWLTGTSLPAACDPLLYVWTQAGYQTSERILERLFLAAQSGAQGRSLALFLAKQLPANQRELAGDVISLQSNPNELVNFARRYKSTDYTKNVVLKTFPLWVKQDLGEARAAIPVLVKYKGFNESQRLSLELSVANRLINNGIPVADALWRDNVIAKSGDASFIERRIRIALTNGDDRDLAKWVNLLPEKAKQEEEWQYWQAHLLMKHNKTKKEGEKILANLMKGRGFYPMMAAQRLNKPYVLQMDTVDAKVDKKLIESAQLARVKELLYWDQDNQARREWISFVSRVDKKSQEKLARYAFDQRWFDLGVQATISGKLWDHLEERFPVAYPHLFTQALRDKQIQPSFAMAIARQESAWYPHAMSPVGARGLMQLMPATAKATAKKINLSYNGVHQLLDPESNIELGTAYLDDMYQRFGYNRILASAAYNAGPHRVDRWLNESAGKLDAVAFIESIPFKETRRYVKNVLSYDVFYSHFMHEKHDVLTTNELARRY